jgi:hypothetical protein
MGFQYNMNQISRFFLKASICLFVVIICTQYGCRHKKKKNSDLISDFSKRHGEISGDPINDNLVVNVVDESTGTPINKAVIYIHQGAPPRLVDQVVTEVEGVASFAGKGIAGPVTITGVCLGKEAYDTLTLVDVNASRVTFPMRLRKDPPRLKSSFSFAPFQKLDARLEIYENDELISGQKIEQIEDKIDIPQNPMVLKISRNPVALIAFTKDDSGSITRLGAAVLPSTPIPVSTPCSIKLETPEKTGYKTIEGIFPNSVANLDPAPKDMPVSSRFSISGYFDRGSLGHAIAGFGRVSDNLKFQIQCYHLLDIPVVLESSVRNQLDEFGETTVSYVRKDYSELPLSCSFTYKKTAKDLKIESKPDFSFPVISWSPGEGDLTSIVIRRDKVDFEWRFYGAAKSSFESLFIPELPAGSIGSLLKEEEYRVFVEMWTIPEFDFNHFDFNQVHSSMTHKSVSAKAKLFIP